MAWNDLATVKLQTKLKPAALAIYRRIFPGCDVEDLRLDGVRVHILDQEFGIDSLIKFESGQWLSLQEKYRAGTVLRRFGADFTQEYKNAAGTEHESPGEWFKLGAQLYFYGWANEMETDFAKWVILDIAKYKMLVELAGGLHVIGTLRQNRMHGRSNFYAIPIEKLDDAIILWGDDRSNHRHTEWLAEYTRQESLI